MDERVKERILRERSSRILRIALMIFLLLAIDASIGLFALLIIALRLAGAL